MTTTNSGGPRPAGTGPQGVRPSGGSGSRPRTGGYRPHSGGARHSGGSSGGARGPRPPAQREPQTPKVIELSEAISLRDLATQINVTPINLIKELMQNGIMATINQQLDFDTAAIVSSTFGWEAKQKQIIVESTIPDEVAVDATGKPTPGRGSKNSGSCWCRKKSWKCAAVRPPRVMPRL